MLKKRIFVCLGLSVFFNFILCCILFHVSFVESDIGKKVMTYVGLSEYDSSEPRHIIEYRCLEGWANSLKKMNSNVDVVFYGNSITFGSNFHELFPECSICNLGCNGDNLDDLIHRSFIISSVHPRRIFILGGINRLQDITIEEFGDKYELLVDTIKKQNPSSKLLLQSILPVNTSMEVGARYRTCQNRIVEANRIIEEIAKNKNCVYIDLYSRYQVNGSMPPQYTGDGLHLYSEAYKVWANAISSYLRE